MHIPAKHFVSCLGRVTFHQDRPFTGAKSTWPLLLARQQNVVAHEANHDF